MQNKIKIARFISHIHFIIIVLFLVFSAKDILAGDDGPWAPAIPYTPPLRDEISLNGTWNFTTAEGVIGTIPVPEYWDAYPNYSTDKGTYELSVTVPSTWTGKRIKLDFEGVSQTAAVYINGDSVGYHIGGWIPCLLIMTETRM